MSDLTRFLSAQEHSFDAALREIEQGQKTGHWMWYIFPQLKGLGRSGTALFYGITDLDEARAFLAHPVLGKRLATVSQAILAHKGESAARILGNIDALKLRSCATLFAAASDGASPYKDILNAFYDGVPCPGTQGLLMG